MEIPQLDAEQAAQAVEEGALLLDVREDDEWAAGHAPGASHIPLNEIPTRAPEIATGRKVVAVCRVGGRSQKAAEFLAASGVDVVNLAGGMRAWAAAGYPVVTDDGQGGGVI
jgi:rhodanese-related sulfurtransferase